MASICSAIDLEFLEPRRWRVARPIVYHHPIKVTVPAGMITDLASTPRLLWPILPPTGSYAPAAILHDYLYLRGRLDGEPITRAYADRVFLEAMRALGVGIIIRRVVYWGVRLGGWVAWNQHRKHDQAA
jgi:hypothetical protein